ncbi:anthranilate synthase family protein [Streptomyces typhae]|uniref:anthranilate synthase family protein n=1 Tax=Streptomyces typhae TaxID=2681492 RepID=UPI0031B5C5C4
MGEPSATTGSAPADRATTAAIERLIGPHPGPFALLWRPAAHGRHTMELLRGPVHELRELGELRGPTGHRTPAAAPVPAAAPAPAAASAPAAAPAARAVLALLPFRQIAERGFACHDGEEPVLALHAEERVRVRAPDVLAVLDTLPPGRAEAAFDLDDTAYTDVVRRVVDEEITTGAGANFVIRRTLSAQLPGAPHRTALAMFARLARQPGAYWTFVVHTGDRTFVGASPERHVSLDGGRAVMNPISGTYRHPPAGADEDGLVAFLADPKETDELSMVVDEELKMMAGVCEHGARLRGPYLKTMAHLTHTEYLLEGDSDRDPVDILRATMFAPTVTGSPLENACRVITRHEKDSRGYYSGVAALIDTDRHGRPALDSAILIRTAALDATGALTLSVGATLVRHSDPASEAAETRAKAAGLLQAAGLRLAGEQPPPHPAAPPHPAPGPGASALSAAPRVREALKRRNRPLAGFWLAERTAATGTGPPPALPLLGVDTLVVDAEDTFTGMLAVQLRALGARTTVLAHHRAATRLTRAAPDLVVLGPGPGDPRNDADPRIRTLRLVTEKLLNGPTAFVAVCLGHQILARTLGLRLRARPVPHQGLQREIDFFGRREHVGFYNSFAAYADTGRVPGPRASEVLVSRDPRTGDVHGLHGPGYTSAQFHPESVLTRNGIDLIAHLTRSALTGRPAPATHPARRSA